MTCPVKDEPVLKKYQARNGSGSVRQELEPDLDSNLILIRLVQPELDVNPKFSNESSPTRT